MGEEVFLLDVEEGGDIRLNNILCFNQKKKKSLAYEIFRSSVSALRLHGAANTAFFFWPK